MSSKLEVKFDAATTTYWFVIPEGWVIVHTARDVFATHWDSGQPDTAALQITLWSSEHVAAYTTKEAVDGRWVYDADYRNGVDYRCVVPGVNAIEEQIAEWEAYKAASRYVTKILDVASKSYYLEHGAVVDVVKGRKVPKGAYEVTKVGEGQYGLFINLRNDKGQTFAYVAQPNIEVRPQFVKTFGESQLTEYAPHAAFLSKLIDSEFQDKTTWLVFADYIEDHDEIPSHAVPGYGEPTFATAQFANALRRIIDGGTIHKLPKYKGVGFRFELRGGLPI